MGQCEGNSQPSGSFWRTFFLVGRKIKTMHTHWNLISGFAVGSNQHLCGRKTFISFFRKHVYGFRRVPSNSEPIFFNLFLSSRTLKTKANPKIISVEHKKKTSFDIGSFNENDRKQFNWTRSFDGRSSFSADLPSISYSARRQFLN